MKIIAAKSFTRSTTFKISWHQKAKNCLTFCVTSNDAPLWTQGLWITIILTHFLKICLFKNSRCNDNQWPVQNQETIPVSVTYSAYSLIPMHSVYFLSDPVLTFLTIILSYFSKTTIKINSKNVRAQLLGVFIEHMGNKSQASQVWLRTVKQAKNCS